MNTNIVNLFYLKRAKPNKLGLIPIYHRTTINGKRIDKSTGKYVDPTKWSTEAGRLKGNSEEARSVNRHLEMLIAKNVDIEKKLIATEDAIDSLTFNAILSGKVQQRTIATVFKDHNTKMKLLVPDEYSEGTLERYETSLSHTIEFMRWKYKVSDMPLNKIDYGFVSDYDFYLRSVRKCANNTTVKYLRNFNKIVKICLKYKWMKDDPFAFYEGKTREVDRDFLIEEELQEIYQKHFPSARLTQVRDIFIFCCFTGLAYIDVKQLTRDHISLGIDGQRWIFKNRQKTDTSSDIPLLPIAEDLLAKYADHPQCVTEGKLLPVLSNQKMNGYLKEIADICGITKNLTFHIARHTFATTVTLTNGVPIESVSKMLGHKNIRTTQHYAKIQNKKVGEDMQLLKEKLKAVGGLVKLA